MEENKKIIRVEDLSFRYPDSDEYILKNVTVDIKEKEFVLIIGPRGEGKSTFLKIISGLILPKEGNVFYDNVGLKSISKKALMNIHRRTGFVFQDSALISNMNIFDNIALPLRYNETFPEPQIKEKVEEMIQYIDMESDKFKLPAFISMGQRRMVAMVRALITGTETMFYDEPIANLDEKSRAKMIKMMIEVNQKGITTVVVTHEIDEFKEVANRIIEFKNRTIFDIREL